MKALITAIVTAVGGLLTYFLFFHTASGSLDFVRVSNAFGGIQSMGGIDPQAQELAGHIALQCKAAQVEVLHTSAQEAVVDMTIERINVTQSLVIDTILTSVSTLAKQSGATPEQSRCLAAITVMKLRFPEAWRYVERTNGDDLKVFDKLIEKR